MAFKNQTGYNSKVALAITIGTIAIVVVLVLARIYSQQIFVRQPILPPAAKTLSESEKLAVVGGLSVSASTRSEREKILQMLQPPANPPSIEEKQRVLEALIK